MAVIKAKSCMRCGFFQETGETFCPTCSRRLFSTTNIRVRGGILLVIGVFLMAMMSYISYFSFRSYAGLNGPNGSRFTGTREEFIGIVALFGALILFGFISALTGVWQLIAGRRNKYLVWLGLGLGVLLYAGALLIIWRY
jgi:hypothetical protein